MPDLDRFCPACGYNLRGVTSDRCPECGVEFSHDVPTESQIPWSHRATIGRWRAFWRTVRLVAFKPRQFARELDRPVDLNDALAFRRTVVWCAWLPIAALATWAYIDGLSMATQPWLADDALGSAIQWVGLPVMAATIWLFLYFATGVQSYAFHPRWLNVRHQNRSIALSYYAAGPWAYLLFTLPVFAAVIWLCASIWHEGDPPVLVTAAIGLPLALVFAAQIFGIWFTPHALLRRVAPVSWTRLMILDVGYMVALVLLAGLSIGLINVAFWGGALVAMSLQLR